ncbi:MAG: hypothetical protein JO247_05560 [Chloroflexi bacterium]|nr:hypothetical protein [Chloroflexota bacterium]
MDTLRRSMTTVQALHSRRRQHRRGSFHRTAPGGEQPYVPSPEAQTFTPKDVSISVGEA